MIGVDVTEVPPTIFVDDLAAIDKRRVAGNDAMNQVLVLLLCLRQSDRKRSPDTGLAIHIGVDGHD